MKHYIFYCAILLSLISFSCKKDISGGGHCFEDVSSSSGSALLGDSALKAAKQLFDENGLDYSMLQFYRFEDNLGYQHVRTYQFVNGVKVFTGAMVYVFKNGVFEHASGNRINEIGLDTKSQMEAVDLIRIYKESVKNDEKSKMIGKSLHRCFDLEFGYYDLKHSSSDTVSNFTKAWKVMRHNEEYPFVFVNDENGELIFYNNGIFE